MTTVPKIKVTYFEGEGNGEPVRLALVLAGVDFIDERVKYADWPALKEKLPYGQVPVMTILKEDGKEVVHSQSGAMVRYVGATFAKDTLYPSEYLFEIEEVIGLTVDFSNTYMGWRPLQYGRPAGFGATEEGKATIKAMREHWVAEELPKYLHYYDALLDKNSSGGGWIATPGPHPTIADCILIPRLRGLTKGSYDHIPATCLDGHPKIVDYIKRFCALPQIQGRYTDGVH